MSFGWILSFSALFTKTNRVNQIFHDPTYKRIKVTVWDVMKPGLGLVTVVGILMAVWTGLSPPEFQRKVSQIDLFGREVQTMAYCNYQEGSLPYVSSLTVVLLGVLAYAINEAYVARNVSTEFAESEYIFLVLTIILLVSFLGIPVTIVAREKAKARFFVAAAITFIICSAVLLLIFVPKVYAFRREKAAASRGVWISILRHRRWKTSMVARPNSAYHWAGSALRDSIPIRYKCRPRLPTKSAIARTRAVRRKFLEIL